MKKYLTREEEDELEDIEAAKKMGLVRVEAPEIDIEYTWFSLLRSKQKHSKVIVRRLIGETHVRIDHLLKDGSIREGGAIRIKELWKNE